MTRVRRRDRRPLPAIVGRAAERYGATRECAESILGAENYEATLSGFRQLNEEPTVGYVLLAVRKPA